MPETIGPAIQSVTDGRLTFKKAHLEYLGNPECVDVTFGPGRSILIHNPQRRQELLDMLLADEEGLLDEDQNQIELRLDSLADPAPVDEQGRMRIPQVYLNRLQLPDKGAKVYLFRRRRNGWIEVWSEAEFDRMIDAPADVWQVALNRLVLRRRGTQV